MMDMVLPPPTTSLHQASNVTIFQQKDCYVDPNSSVHCEYPQNQLLEGNDSMSPSSVEITLGQGTIIHPYAKLIIIVPPIRSISNSNRSDNAVIKVAIGMYNVFEEQSTVKMDSTVCLEDNTNETLTLIGNYNTFGPKCSVVDLSSIGSDNSFEAYCNIFCEPSGDSKDLLRIRSTCIRDGCVFGPMVRLNVTNNFDQEMWYYLVAFLLDGNIRIRSCKHLDVAALRDTRHKEIESLGALLIKNLLEKDSK